MLAEAKANGYDLPIDLDAFSKAIMSGRPHAEVHLQFGRCDGTVGRSNLHCWKTDPGESVVAGWLYELDTIAVSVLYVQKGKFEHRSDLWHPHSRTSSKRFKSLISGIQCGTRVNSPDRTSQRERCSGQAMR